MTSMTEVKTAELTGPALDWAVAHATKAWEWAHEWYPTMTLDPTFRGVSDNAPGGAISLIPRNPMRQDSQPFTPSTDWAQGGRLIEKYKMGFGIYENSLLAVTGHNDFAGSEHGATHLIAACRAIVSAHLGDCVNVPKGLLS